MENSNNRLRFRAWDTKRGKMWSAEEMGKDQLTLMPDGRGFINVDGTSTELSQFVPNLIPLQFTGLDDKNGKELDWWEGDIFDDAGVLKVIVKDKGCFWFENIKSKRRIPCYDVADSYGDWANDIKKVGNIHQPELMEQDNG